MLSPSAASVIGASTSTKRATDTFAALSKRDRDRLLGLGLLPLVSNTLYLYLDDLFIAVMPPPSASHDEKHQTEVC